MTNAPTTRKTHVIRILGTNRNGDVLSHIWVDVERTDKAKFATQLIDNDWQGHQRKFLWMDDPNSDNYESEGNPARKHFIVKVCDPHSSNVDDPDEWVPIKVIRWSHSRGGGGSLDGLGTMHRYRVDPNVDDPTVTTRVIKVRKISHYNTSIDEAAQAAFDADPSLPVYVVPGDQYIKDLSTKDDTQFVDHEIVTAFKKRTNETSPKPKLGGVDRGRQTKLLNQYLIDESDVQDGQIIGVSGINPPYRLDPYQSIVNVQFRSLYLVVFVSAGNEVFNTFSSTPGTSSPSILVAAGKSTKLLDKQTPPGSVAGSSGFNRCVAYAGDSLASAYLQFRNLLDPSFNDGIILELTDWASTNSNSCPLPTGVVIPDGVTVGPAEFFGFASVGNSYLYTIPATDGVLTIGVGGLVPSTPEPLLGGASSSGGANITIFVYSTVKKKIKKLSDIIDINGDGKPRPTEDDKLIINLTSITAGKFRVNVKLETDTSKKQTDNYGNKFLPYKVTLDHGAFEDIIPPQPPPLLPK